MTVIDYRARVKAAKKVVPPTEFALANMVVERHGTSIIYIRQLGRWHVWNEHIWAQEKTFSVFDMIRKTISDLELTTLEKAKTVSAVETLTKTDGRVGVTSDQLDSDFRLLNTPGHTTDLKGHTRPHDRKDYCTKSTSITPADSSECPLFKRFLDTIFEGDCDTVDYLQKVLGYCLTGETREHALFFLYGTGANGKSVLLSTVSGILGSYCKTAAFETFAHTNTPGHPTDVASLMGARLVICSEVEQGRRWAESKVKMLTGGDRIEARFMRQDFFEFTPQFKLMIAGNHKPGLRNVDEAIRRRMHLIPFNVTIPEGERDKHLADKLKEEWPGILKWMIDGCLRWQEEGLEKPEAVKAATDEYLASEDTVLSWIEEKCETGNNFEADSSALFSSWGEWAETNGEVVGSHRAFSQKLLDRGFKSRRVTKGMAYGGIRVKL